MEQRTAKEITKLQELTYELKVEHAMTTKVITVSPDATMAEFREVLRVNRISGTPVVERARWSASSASRISSRPWRSVS